MKVCDERKYKPVNLCDLMCGQLFSVFDCSDIFLKTSLDRDSKGSYCIVCVNIEDGEVKNFSELMEVVPVEAEVVLK